ncbi:uncharacterized protein BDV17DRAFT_183034 [Aspergillus undulatus]|uniref:uncharacterized protein n=1 Tax=Aspergillus undulatus TaxID=1810928 RepID=UPI003CCCC0CC
MLSIEAVSHLDCPQYIFPCICLFSIFFLNYGKVQIFVCFPRSFSASIHRTLFEMSHLRHVIALVKSSWQVLSRVGCLSPLTLLPSLSPLLPSLIFHLPWQRATQDTPNRPYSICIVLPLWLYSRYPFSCVLYFLESLILLSELNNTASFISVSITARVLALEPAAAYPRLPGSSWLWLQPH